LVCRSVFFNYGRDSGKMAEGMVGVSAASTSGSYFLSCLWSDQGLDPI